MSLSKFYSYVRNSAGDAVSSTVVKVYAAGTTTLQDIYSDEDGTVPIVNSEMLSDVDGYFEFYSHPADVDIKFSKAGHTFRNLLDISIGRQAAPEQPETNNLQGARIMWRVTRYQSKGTFTLPSDADMVRITDGFNCNYIQADGAYNATESQINALLELSQLYDCKVILELFLSSEGAVADFVSKWENHDQVAGFSIEESSAAYVNNYTWIHTHLPVIAAVKIDTFASGYRFLPATSLHAPLFLTILTYEMYGPGSDYYMHAQENPPSSGPVAGSIVIDLHSKSWKGIPFIPTIPFMGVFYDSGAPVADPDDLTTAMRQNAYSPAPERESDIFELVGGLSASSVIIDGWSLFTEKNVSGFFWYKGGIKEINDDTWSMVEKLKSHITRSILAQSYLGGARTSAVSYEQAYDRWADNLLINSKLFPSHETQLPYGWSSDPDPVIGDFTISHDIDTNECLVKVSSPTDYQNLHRKFKLPPWFIRQFAGKPLTFRVMGWAESSDVQSYVIFRIKQYIGELQTQGNSPEIYMQVDSVGTNTGSRPYMISVPLNPNVVQVAVELTFNRVTAYFNDLRLTMGFPTEGLGHDIRNRYLQVGGLTRDIFTEPYNDSQPQIVGPMPAYLFAGTISAGVPASSTSLVPVHFNSGVFDEQGIAQGDTDLHSMKFVSAVHSLYTLTGGTPMENVVHQQMEFSPGNRTVTVQVKNLNAFAIDVIISVIAVAIPIKYETML